MRDGVLVEGLALCPITVPPVEALHADTGVEDDHAIAAAPRPSFGEGEQPRANAFALASCRNRHLLELKRVWSQGLEGH